MAAVMDCRMCLEKKKHLVEINNEIRDTFYLITQMRLHRLEYFSNSICLICYKKMLAAQGYRDMLVKIEEKLLNTFMTNPNKPTSGPRITKNSMRTLTNGASTSAQQIPVTKPSVPETKQNYSYQLKREMQTKSDDPVSEDEDMSLLEEIVSFSAPDASNFLNEDNDNHFSLLSDSELQNDDDDDDELQFKQEPFDRPIVEIDESSNSLVGFHNGLSLKPFRCDIAGCVSSSTTIKALKKHKRRVHGISSKQSVRMLDTSMSIKRPPMKKLKLEENPLMQSLGVDDSTPYQCKYCNLILRNRRVLCRHIETVHKQAKFYCTITGCKHASTRKDNYRLHLKNYHRNLPEEELNQALMLTKNMQPIYVNKDFEMYEDEEEQIQLMALKCEPEISAVTSMAGSSMMDENESDWLVKLTN